MAPVPVPAEKRMLEYLAHNPRWANGPCGCDNCHYVRGHPGLWLVALKSDRPTTPDERLEEKLVEVEGDDMKGGVDRRRALVDDYIRINSDLVTERDEQATLIASLRSALADLRQPAGWFALLAIARSVARRQFVAHRCWHCGGYEPHQPGCIVILARVTLAEDTPDTGAA